MITTTILVILGLAGLAIGWPTLRYQKTKRDGYLTMSIVQGVFAGVSALYLLLVVTTNGMPVIIWTIPLFACSAISLIDVIRVWTFGK